MRKTNKHSHKKHYKKHITSNRKKIALYKISLFKNLVTKQVLIALPVFVLGFFVGFTTRHITYNSSKITSSTEDKLLATKTTAVLPAESFASASPLANNEFIAEQAVSPTPSSNPSESTTDSQSDTTTQSSSNDSTTTSPSPTTTPTPSTSPTATNNPSPTATPSEQLSTEEPQEQSSSEETSEKNKKTREERREENNQRKRQRREEIARRREERRELTQQRSQLRKLRNVRGATTKASLWQQFVMWLTDILFR